MAQGGTDLVAVKERSVYTLAPQHNRWTPHPDNPISYPEDVEDICFCSVPGGLFGMGGRNKQTGNVSKKCYYFNGQTHQWEPKPDMINARHSASAAVLGDEILVVGGETSLVNPEEKNKGERFNFRGSNMVWQPLPSLVKPSMRWNQLLDAPMLKPLVASAAGILFVVPRQDIENIHPDDTCMQQFKPGDNSFVKVQLPFDLRERTCACLVAFEDMLYLISGFDGKVFRYDPVSVTHQWTVLTQGNPQLPRGCSALAVEVEGGSSNILVCGSSVIGRGYRGMDVFHPQTPEEWRPYISLPFPAAGDSNLTLEFEFDWENSYVFSM